MSSWLEKRGFREAVRAEVAEVVTAEELAAFNSTGDPDCCFETEVPIAVPSIRTVRERKRGWQKLVAVRGRSFEIVAQQLLEEEAVATPQDIRNRYNDQLSRCVQLGNEGRLTHAWKKFRKRHLPEIWEREEAAVRGFPSGQTA
jgi:hypothetical protein